MCTHKLNKSNHDWQRDSSRAAETMSNDGGRCAQQMQPPQVEEDDCCCFWYAPLEKKRGAMGPGSDGGFCVAVVVRCGGFSPVVNTSLQWRFPPAWRDFSVHQSSREPKIMH